MNQIPELPVEMSRFLIAFSSKMQWHEISAIIEKTIIPQLSKEIDECGFTSADHPLQESYVLDFDHKKDSESTDKNEVNNFLFGFELMGDVSLFEALSIFRNSVVPAFIENNDIEIESMDSNIQVHKFYREDSILPM